MLQFVFFLNLVNSIVFIYISRERVNMNIESLKLGFINYLQELNESSDKEYAVNDSNISIFMYASEFKSYIEEELNVSNDILSMSINDILDMEVKNGKLVNPEEEENETTLAETKEEANSEQNIQENTNTEQSSIPQEETSVEQPIQTTENIQQPVVNKDGAIPEENPVQPDNTLITDILNTLFQEEDVINTLDTDENGELNEEEIDNFLNTIKDLDGNEEDISLDDIINAVESIKNDEFKIEGTDNSKETEEEVKQEEIKETEPTQTQNNTSSTSGGGGNSYSGNSTSSNKTTKDNSTKEKDLNSMSKSELNEELDSAKTTLDEGQNVLSSILDGTEEGLVKLQEAEDEAYKTYEDELKVLNEEMAKELDEKKTAVSDKEKEIDTKSQEIADQETVVSTAENSYNSAVSSRESLEASLSSLESTDTSKMEDAQKTEISSKISNLKAKITEAKQAETEAKTAWNEAQEKLDSLNEEKTTLEEEKSKLDENLTAFEQQIAEKYPQIAEYQQAYNDAKTAKDEYKTGAQEAIKKDIQEVQNYINEINTALTNIENKEKSKEYSVNTLGDDAVDFAKQFIGANEGDGSANKFLNGKSAAQIPWCAAFVEYIMENNNSADSIPDWYKNIENKWYCPNIDKAAKDANAFISGDEAKPGDIVLFDYEGDGRMNHIGIVVSNENGKLVTIEGNTSNKVAEKEYDTNDSRIKYCKMTA